MQPQFAPARSPAAHRVWSEVLQPLAAELRVDAPELSITVVSAIREQFPELFPTDDDFEENRASSEANIVQFAELVADGRAPSDAELPAVAIAYIRAGVHRGFPLAAFLRSLRLGHAVAWQAILRELEERSADSDQLAAAVDLASAWMFAYIDVLSSFGEETYASERERWSRSAAAVQSDTINAILNGQDVDGASASRRLGYQLEREHVALVGWYDSAEDGRDTIAELEAMIVGLTRTLGAEDPVIETLGLLSVAGWVGSRSGFDELALDSLLLDAGIAPQARFALGEPASGVAGFRRSHREALEARRVASLAARPPGTVTRYRRVALSAMATADMAQARALVDRELGGLTDRDDASTRLVATLRIFLEEGASHSRTAKRLGIHENTVRYRIRQGEEILGRGVAERTLELQVALTLLQLVNDG